MRIKKKKIKIKLFGTRNKIGRTSFCFKLIIYNILLFCIQVCGSHKILSTRAIEQIKETQRPRAIGGRFWNCVNPSTMATTPTANFPLLRLPRPHSRFSLPPSPSTTLLRRKLRPATIRAAVVGDGDFGARDPFPAEIESNFGDKVIGFSNTEHKILIPNVRALALSQQQCVPISSLQAPMPEDEAQKLLKKVIISDFDCPIVRLFDC